MKKRFFLIISTSVLLFGISLWFVIHKLDASEVNTNKRDSERYVNEITLLPDTMFASAEVLEVEVRIYDTVSSGILSSLSDLYVNQPGIFTFRGGPTRAHVNKGKLKGSPSNVRTDWIFRTPFDTVMTEYGRWGGGTGWTGQPLLIKWSDSLKDCLSKVNDTLMFCIPDDEIIFTSLCGDVFFLDFETGIPTRRKIYIGNTLKGTPGIDPTLGGLLYVGHGIPRDTSIGISVINLLTHKTIQFIRGIDPFAGKTWGAFDSSPIAVGQFLFWAGENGLVYKFSRTKEGLKPHSTLRYRMPGKIQPGIESSIAICKNYGYFGDNHGNIICFNLNTMLPVWHFDNHDDTDASIVVEEEDGIPYIFTGSQVDRQGDSGFSYFTKLNGLDGSLVWQQKMECRSIVREEKKYDGGILSTPLLGEGNCRDLIFTIISLPDASVQGDLIAFRKKDGKIIWKQRLGAWSWSSPVPFYNEHDSLFIFTGDVAGNIYMIEGTSGKIVFKKRLGQNFESSPLVIGNSVVFGSRGRNMYRFTIE